MSWTQNIEYIFRQEELDALVISGHLEKVNVNGTVYYVKKGCGEDFRKIKTGLMKNERTM